MEAIDGWKFTHGLDRDLRKFYPSLTLKMKFEFYGPAMSEKLLLNQMLTYNVL